MEKKFKEVEKAFEELKRKFREKEISRMEFIDQLKTLRLKDKKGRFWMIGSQSGMWYFHDGEDWIQSEPPSIQEGKAICIYCGFENKIESVLCARCGQKLTEEEYYCKNCGHKLDRPDQDCPNCSKEFESIVREEIEAKDEDLTEEAEEDKGKDSIRENEELMAEEEEKEDDEDIDEKMEEAFKGERTTNFVFRSLSPLSFLLFWGAFGLLLGIIIGAFTGATDYFYEIGRVVPSFLKSFQGNLLGGIIYAIVGGVVGFIAFGVFGFCITYIINFALAIAGGIKIRMEKIK